MPRRSCSLSTRLLAVSAAALGLSGCGSVVIDETSVNETTTSTSSTSTTASTTSTTTSSSTSTTTTTEPECECDFGGCSAGEICDGCFCVPDPNACPGGDNCICTPGEIIACYSGPPGTEGVGLCLAGTQVCEEGLAWGPCEGEGVPTPESCNGLDDDCDGVVDFVDIDGDGWTVCDGDCCEDLSCSDHPEKVNPGAIEYPGDQIDNDCNPATLDGSPYATCTGPALDGPVTSLKLLKAMDLCQFTTESPPLAQRTWGVISSSLTLADGSEAVPPKDVQMGVLAHYGPNVTPRYGTTMAALSTGTARAEGDPGFVYPQSGPDPGQSGNFNAQTIAGIPADYLAAHNGAVPTKCIACNFAGCEVARDSVRLQVRLRVPTNVTGMSYDLDFYTAEYPQNLCTQYNDFFLALLDAQQPAPGLPDDRNIAKDSMGNTVSVNDAHFDICLGCAGGNLELAGTGMGGWNGALNDGAATGWLRNVAPVTPGDTIELRFVVWDAWDGNVDSVVLLDRVRFGDLMGLGGGGSPD